MVRESENVGTQEQSAVKVSVIVPVYNGAGYLKENIESLLNQTLREIEIICVDDGSTDDSVMILEKLRMTDPRLRIIRHKENSWACQARRTGVQAASGRYIMLMDQDDTYTPDACEIAYQAIEEQQVDVLQYGTEIINCANIPQRRIAANEKLLMPYCGGRLDEDLLKACFLEKKFFFQIWNKIYRSEICKKAFAEIEDGRFPYAEDLYACFLVLYYTKSYAGIENQLYRYHFGRGTVGFSEISLDTFKRFCSSEQVYNALQRFLEKKGADVKSAYAPVLERIREGLINECCIKWRDLLETEQKGAGFDVLKSTWGLTETVSWFADKSWYKKTEIACGVQEAECLKYQARPVRTIALYYHNIHNGGAQHVVAQLCNMLAAQKKGEENRYRVILVTDEICDQEYALNEKIERVVVPARSRFPKESYRVRAEFWDQFLTKYQVDTVLNSMWEDQTLFWDMLCIKGHPSHPAMVVHCHSFAGILYKLQGDATNETRFSFALADYLITLSDADTRYWRHINAKVKCVGNPVDIKGIPTEEKKSEGKNILWIGRIAREKQPLELISVMSRIVREIPEAVCYIAGDGEEELKEQMRREIDSRNLQDHIVFCGYQSDVSKLYCQADVMISTSQFEGFPLTWYESAAYGVPIVAYEVPWLMANQQLRGLVSVPQNYSARCAQEVVKLLNDSVYYAQMSAGQKESFLEYQKEDIAQKWRDVFTALEQSEKPETKADPEEGMLFSQISIFGGRVKEEIKAQREELRRDRDRQKCQKEEAQAKQREAREEIERMRGELKRVREKLTAKKEENVRVRAKLEHYKERLEEEKQRGSRLKQKLDDVHNSASYKIGRKATWLPRKLKEGFSKEERS